MDRPHLAGTEPGPDVRLGEELQLRILRPRAAGSLPSSRIGSDSRYASIVAGVAVAIRSARRVAKDARSVREPIPDDETEETMHDFIQPPGREIAELLAPGGVLRAGVNLSNFLLVTGRTPDGDPIGVSPDMARALAGSLGAGVRYVCYESPGLVADAAERDEWDVALIGAEPQRAAVIAFAPAYTEIEASYLVPEASPIREIAEVDRAGVRIAVTDRTAYGLWLDRNIARAELVRTKTIDEAAEIFVDQRLEALAGLRPRLIADVEVIPNTRILDGRFMAVRQAIGTPIRKAQALDYLQAFVRGAIESGFVASLIRKHRVEGLTTAEIA